MRSSYRAYQGGGHGAGLITLTPEGVALRERLIQAWRDCILTPLRGHQVATPILIPEPILESSGHVRQFGDELYRVDGTGLMLRPQTAQGIFADYKTLRMTLKGSPLVIGQVGKAFRRQCTTRRSDLRCTEFEQMEVEVFYTNPDQYPRLWAALGQRLRQYFQSLGLQAQAREITNLPHYSRATTDYYLKDWQIACVNDRGNHDLHRSHPGVYVLQVSIGLTRLINLCLQ